jgi:hypothetical protein
MDTMSCSFGAGRYFVRVGCGIVCNEVSNEMKVFTELLGLSIK